MPEIKPFRAIMYDPHRVNLGSVVAPPYDVISPERRKQLYDLSPYNIVRLILGREKDAYGSAASTFAEWLTAGMLSPAAEPAVYVLTQQFRAPDGAAPDGAPSGGAPIVRRGFIAACRLEEFGKGSIFPHELTHSGPKEDRLRLFEATNAMFSQIFSLYSDPKHILAAQLDQHTQRAPDVDVEFDHIRNKMWKVHDNALILGLAGFLQGQRVLVADGHHRYETALNYSRTLRLKNPRHSGTEPYNFIPMYFTDMNNPGLLILPTHRIVRDIPGFNRDTFLAELGNHFEIRFEDLHEDLTESLAAHKEGAFGLVLQGEPGFALLSYKNRGVPGLGELPALVARLDVTVLHSVIMKGILHISEADQDKKLHLDYEQDAGRAVRTVRQRKGQAAFLLNPTRIERVRAIAEAGFTMPRKSTFFYPKLLSGLVTYSFIGP